MRRVESTLSSHLQTTTSSPRPFTELVSSLTELWTSLGSDIELESPEEVVKDAVKDVLLRVIRDGALAAAVRVVRELGLRGREENEAHHQLVASFLA
jgi:hypothetical protein